MRANRAGELFAFAAATLLAAIALAYHNSLGGPFVFDDFPAIRHNPTIRTLWPPTAFSPPADTGVGGRPLANFSFALSRALGGGDVRAHHAANLLLHAGSALLLFGIAGRLSCRRRSHPAEAGVCKTDALQTGVAFAAALMWAVHPLATAAVTYLSQRTELLMAFCGLLTLYCFVRGWFAASVVACACGMLSKENMATVPLVVLLFDRTFVAGTFRAALRQRAGYYSALAATWLVLGYVLTTGLHQRSVGFGLGVSAFDYALTECRALVLYLKLTLWPSPLVFDYGRVYEASPAATAACVALVLALVAWTARAVWRGTAAGFAAGAFLLLLAPSSSFVPVAETPIAENRAYLPLAVVMVAAVATVRSVFQAHSDRDKVDGDLRAPSRTATKSDGARRSPSTFVLLAASLALGLLTVARNHDYRSEVALWTDTVAKRPQSARAHFNRGVALLDASRASEAAAEFERAIQLNPREPKAHNSLGNALLELGRAADALPHFAQSVTLQPRNARAWFNYGTAHFRLGRSAEAAAQFERALQLDPRFAEAENALGNVFFQTEQPARAIPHYEAALRLDPALATAHYNAGSACLELGRIAEAVAHFAAATQLKPADAEIRNFLGAALVRAGRLTQAVAEFETALRLKPDYGDARDNLALIRAERQRTK